MDLWVPDSLLDRVGDQRLNPHWVGSLWEGETSLLLQIDAESSVPMDSTGRGLRLTRPHGDYDAERHHLIGLVQGRPVFAVESTLAGAALPLREASVLVDDTHRDLVTTAVALLNWHRVAPHCGVCGGDTEVRQGGHMRYCPACDRERYPRTDPAVIVAILDDDGRLLLGHHVGWDDTRVSLLAGFVDAGESLEQAVRREVAEESGLELADIRYIASQPWPFPRSLMLGFVARAASTDIHVDGEEIDHAAFYTTHELADLIAAGTLTPPGKASIASALIASWRRGELTVEG